MIGPDPPGYLFFSIIFFLFCIKLILVEKLFAIYETRSLSTTTRQPATTKVKVQLNKDKLHNNCCRCSCFFGAG